MLSDIGIAIFGQGTEIAILYQTGSADSQHVM